jgi:hypothetical protein
MKTLNDLNRRLARLGRFKRVLNLDFSSHWQWLALTLMLAGYGLSSSAYLDIHLKTLGIWTQVAFVTFLIVGSVGGLFLLQTVRKTSHVAARWCWMAALCPLWMPSFLIIEGLPTLIFTGLVMELVFLSCRLACSLEPAKLIQTTHDKA